MEQLSAVQMQIQAPALKMFLVFCQVLQLLHVKPLPLLLQVVLLDQVQFYAAVVHQPVHLDKLISALLVLNLAVYKIQMKLVVITG